MSENTEKLISNELREFLGLNPLIESFTFIEIEGVKLYFEGDVIRKIISYKNFEQIYSETDTEIFTENKEIMLPSSKHGKKKPLDLFNIGKIKHRGILMRIKQKSEQTDAVIEIENRYNNLDIKIPLPETINEVTDFVTYVPDLMRSAPEHWEKMITNIKITPKRTIRYKNGDIVRIALNWNKFAYGLIIGKFSEYRKWGLIPEDHPFACIMTVPVVVRLYDFLTSDPEPTLEQLSKVSLQSPVIAMDDSILRNTFPVLLHKELEKEDILFPAHCSILYKSSEPNNRSIGYHVTDNTHLKHLLSLGYQPQLSLAWGFGMKTKYANELENDLPPLDEYMRASNTGISGLYVVDVDGKPHSRYPDFMNHPKREEIFQYFGVDPKISFDEFNRQHKGYTREEYLSVLKNKFK